MKVGDKIRYNAFGQKNNTLGMVMDLKKIGIVDSRYQSTIPTQLGDPGIWMAWVQWWQTGTVMPRRWTHAEKGTTILGIPKPGDIVWHEAGPWFEVVS
tara:strand:- start:189 stop:482 length:294 start_codon:yes stop_codon:yes gene_type:complete